VFSSDSHGHQGSSISYPSHLSLEDLVKEQFDSVIRQGFSPFLINHNLCTYLTLSGVAKESFSSLGIYGFQLASSQVLNPRSTEKLLKSCRSPFLHNLPDLIKKAPNAFALPIARFLTLADLQAMRLEIPNVINNRDFVDLCFALPCCILVLRFFNLPIFSQTFQSWLLIDKLIRKLIQNYFSITSQNSGILSNSWPLLSIAIKLIQFYFIWFHPIALTVLF